jgi:hypothetical protein
MIASGGGGRVAMLGFTAAVILTWTWTAAVGVDRYRGLTR